MKRILTYTLLGIFAAHALTAQQNKPRPPQVVAPRASKPIAAPLAAPVLQVHQNTLAWDPSSDATTSTYSNVYRVSGACPASSALTNFTKINTDNSVPPAGPYVDTINLTAGASNSYVVTNVIGGVESSASNCVTATTPTFPPNGLSVTAQ